MPRINLLPHRESRRRERKLKFFVALVAAAGAGVVTAFAAYLMYGSMIDAQQHRNDRLRAQIKTLDKQIEEINDLESAEAEVHRAHGDHREAAALASGDRARVR